MLGLLAVIKSLAFYNTLVTKLYVTAHDSLPDHADKSSFIPAPHLSSVSFPTGNKGKAMVVMQVNFLKLMLRHNVKYSTFLLGFWLKNIR